VVSTLITAAIVAGVGAYWWLHTHQSLQITKLSVAAANPKVGCDGTANLIGTIITNGHSGPISYEWVLNGAKKGVLKATAGSGSSTLEVSEEWTFHGKGSGRDIAELDILSPGQSQASITFPFSC
jgi:hypothetical protein